MPKFKQGQSGNPHGRPKGSRNYSTRLLEALDEDASELMRVTKEKALGGDMTAMKLLLDRILPVRRAVAPSINLPGLLTADSLSDKARAVLSGVGAGKVSPDIAGQLITAIANTAKVVETDDLIRRIECLEQNG